MRVPGGCGDLEPLWQCHLVALGTHDTREPRQHGHRAGAFPALPRNLRKSLSRSKGRMLACLNPRPGLSRPQMMSAPTASPPTRWPACTATWTWCTSAGDTAGSQRPSRSPPWSPGRLSTPSASTGCPPSVASSMRGEALCSWACTGRDKGSLCSQSPSHPARPQQSPWAPEPGCCHGPLADGLSCKLPALGVPGGEAKEHQKAKPARIPQSAIRE